MKTHGEKISCLTAYDASFSALLDNVGIDVLLVGDSLGMVIQGHHSTIPVTLENVIYHTQCVTRVRKRAFVIADLPFMTYTTPVLAAENAMKLMQQGAQMVKLEGSHLKTVQLLVEHGVPVCGHLGLLPQQVYQTGGYQVQGKTPESAEHILSSAIALEKVGIRLLLLECVPANLAKQITQSLKIPVIGIGAGVDCDGQILVLHDMLNISFGKRPRFSQNFMKNAKTIQEAIIFYHNAVKTAQFPKLEHSF